jgi:hypothetical protein
MAGSEPQPVAESRDSYAFVANIRSLAEGAFQLAEGHTLRRAAPEEIAEIRQRVGILTAGFVHPLASSLWETPWPVPIGRVEPLPEIEWRYFVIGFQGPNLAIGDLQRAFDLAQMELEIAFTVVYSQHLVGPGFGFHPDRFYQLVRHAPYAGDFFVDVGGDDVAHMVEIHTLLRSYAESSETGVRLAQ